MQGPSAGIETMAREVVKIREELYASYAGRTGKTCAQIHAAPHHDHWLRASEVHMHGLIDEMLMHQP